MTLLPKILIIDDILGWPGESRQDFCLMHGLIDMTGDQKPEPLEKTAVAEGYFCPGQIKSPDGSVRNDVEATLAAARSGWPARAGWRWAMILLDRSFRPAPGRADDEFGYQLLTALNETWPEKPLGGAVAGQGPACQIPIVMLTSLPLRQGGNRANELRATAYVEKHSLVIADLLLRKGLYPDPGGRMLGRSLPFLRALREMRIAACEARGNLLILGETGSGKSHCLKFIHEHSARAGGPLIECTVHAQADPLMLKADLVGCWKGAHATANHHVPGKVERAHDGILFLDEIANLDDDSQNILLELGDHPRGSSLRRFSRLGNFPCAPQVEVTMARHSLIPGAKLDNDSHRIGVDLCLITASNRLLDDPQGRLAAGFHEDLYFRLSERTIRLPPLRERAEDIPELFGHLINESGGHLPGACGKEVVPEVMQLLMAYPWPGNMRTLLTVAQYAAESSQTFSVVYPNNLPPWVLSFGALSAGVPARGSAGQAPPPAPEASGFMLQPVAGEPLKGSLPAFEKNGLRQAAKLLKAALLATRNHLNGEIKPVAAVNWLLPDKRLSAPQAADKIKRMLKTTHQEILAEILDDPDLKAAWEWASAYRHNDPRNGTL